jgi:hypothetical protein
VKTDGWLQILKIFLGQAGLFEDGAATVSPLACFSASHNLSKSAAVPRPLDSQAMCGQAQARNVRIIITGGKTGVLNLLKHDAEVHAGKIPPKWRTSNL